MIKNTLDTLIGGVSYWGFGWALAYGEGGNPVFGGSNFFSVGMDYSNYPSWFFQFVFAATTTTIVSGAIAERAQFMAYLIYSFVITGIVYPPVSHWAWDGDTPGKKRGKVFKCLHIVMKNVSYQHLSVWRLLPAFSKSLTAFGM